MKLFDEHQKLLMKRESRVVMGKKSISLWLLVMVLAVTFFSIAFSKGSTTYLNEKMNDPFTNWVNINLFEADDYNKVKALKGALNLDSIQRYYLFDGWQTVNRTSISLFHPNDSDDLFHCLSYENLSNNLIEKVLSDENVIGDYTISPDSIDENSMGIIATLNTIKKLGYDTNSIPAFLDYRQHSPGADTLGVKLMKGDYARAPLPLLAVVKRLPMNKEIIGSQYLYQQMTDNEMHPLCMNNQKYIRELRFFVPEEVTDFTKECIVDILPDTLKSYVNSVLCSEQAIQDRLRTWRNGSMYRIYLSEEPIPSLPAIGVIEENVLKHFSHQGVVRAYDYIPSTTEGWKKNMGVNNRETMDDIISVHFCRLDSIRAFEQFVLKISDLQIEMTQVNQKENFNFVSTMANILTFALVVFAILTIIIFIVNMMQSYFQKVKRNLGTFKAFGISTKELMKVYVTLVLGIVTLALVIALTITWSVELLLLALNITKEGGAPHLILWNMRTLWAIVIILVSSVLSVIIVMHRMLRQTPGNLIYDR